jgi:hypothetical protein
LIVHTNIKQPAKASVKHSFVSGFQGAKRIIKRTSFVKII